MNVPEILTAEDGKLILSLEEGLYPLDVVYGAAYIFIDLAYVLLGREGTRLVIEMAAKDPDTDEAALRAIAGDFGNELLSQALRRRITAENQTILETIVSQALAGATGAVIPDAFDDEEEGDLDFLDDPLGIAVPWEERFKKRGSAAPERGPAPLDDGPAAEPADAEPPAEPVDAEPPAKPADPKPTGDKQ